MNGASGLAQGIEKGARTAAAWAVLMAAITMGKQCFGRVVNESTGPITRAPLFPGRRASAPRSRLLAEGAEAARAR